MQHFELDPRLAADTVPVANFVLCEVLLSRNAAFPWLILVPRRAGALEIIDLDEADRAVLIEEIARTSQAVRYVTRCDKLNVAALGNQVRQLHVHVIGRFRDDAAWPNPVWGGRTKAYAEADREELVARLRDAFERV